MPEKKKVKKTTSKKPMFLKTYIKFLCDKKMAAAELGVSILTVNKWIREDKDLKEILKFLDAKKGLLLSKDQVIMALNDCVYARQMKPIERYLNAYDILILKTTVDDNEKKVEEDDPFLFPFGAEPSFYEKGTPEYEESVKGVAEINKKYCGKK